MDKSRPVAPLAKTSLATPWHVYALPARLTLVFRACRAHQWVKNLLLAVPALAAHQWQPSIWSLLVNGWVVWSCVSSALYLLNDSWDLDADRQHPTKRSRPLAAGQLTLTQAHGLMASLLMLGGLAALTLPPAFLGCLGFYILGTLLYGRHLKQLMILDVVALALLYDLRLVAGAALTATPLSRWLIIFSLFVFLALALLKRIAEIQTTQPAAHATLTGRAYYHTDTQPLFMMTTASAFLSIFLLALYLTSPEVTQLYHLPALLWIGWVLILVWWCRLLLRTARHEIEDDPVLALLRDPWTLNLTVLLGLVFWLAL